MNKLSKIQIIISGLIIHIITAIYSSGAHHPDEIFQIYEFAGLKLGLNDLKEIPWEYNAEMRSGIQPFLVYIISKLFINFNIFNPFLVATFFRCFASLLSFLALLLLVKELINKGFLKTENNWVWVLIVLFWPLPYFHARFSAENFSSTLFMFGIVLFLKSGSKSLNLIFTGLLFGIAFHARFHCFFMIMGFVIWLLFICKTKIKSILFIFLGFVFALFLGVVIDYWLYNKFTFTPTNYVIQNIIYNKASQFGTQPFYYYISESIIYLIPPFSLIIISGAIVFWVKKKNHLLTFITFPFVAAHFFVAHKELRFLFPVLNFLPLMFVLIYDEIIQYKKWHEIIKNKIIRGTLIITNVIGLIVFGLSPASSSFKMLNVIYESTLNHNTILVYKSNNPYNNLNSLNYFRNNKLKLIALTDTSSIKNNFKSVYYYDNSFNKNSEIKLNAYNLKKYYSTLPNFIDYLNFNGWLDRANCHTIFVYSKE